MAPTALSLSLSLSLSLPLSRSLSVQTHAHTHNVRGPPLLTGSHMLGTTDRALNGLSSTCARAREEGGGGLVYYIGVYSYWGPGLAGSTSCMPPGSLS
jgi:hypothetical protein